MIPTPTRSVPALLARLLFLGLSLLAPPSSAGGQQQAAPAVLLAPLTGKLDTVTPRPGEPAPCQPENFVPGEYSAKRVFWGDPPKALYELPSGEEFNINGWEKENEDVVELPAPYQLTYYAFGCASSTSYVLQITRDGKPYALLQHVNAFKFDLARHVFFLDQSERKNGQYQEFIGLLDLFTLKRTPLPQLDCVAGWHALGSKGRLITYGDARAAEGHHTAVCVWGPHLEFVGRVYADLDWFAGSEDFLMDELGLLQPEVLYDVHYDRAEDSRRCEIRLQSLARQDASKTVDLGNPPSPGECRALAQERLKTLRFKP